MANYEQGQLHVSQDGTEYALQGNEWVPTGRASKQQVEAASKALGNTDIIRPGANGTQYLAPASEWAGNVARAVGYGAAKGIGAGGLLDQAPESQAQRQALQTAYPASDIAGRAAPSVAAAIATGGMSIPVQAGVQGVMGALASDPGDELFGAAIGTTLGALPALANVRQAPAMAQRALGAARGRVAGAAENVINTVADVRGVPRPATMAQRVTGAATGADEGRYLPGMLSEDAITAAGGVVTPGKRIGLAARNSDEFIASKRANWADEIAGVGETEANINKNAFTNIVRKELGIGSDVALNDIAIGARMSELSKGFQRFAKEADLAGAIEVTPTMRSGINAALDASTNDFKPVLEKIVKQLDDSVAKEGRLSPAVYNNLRTRLADQMLPGGNPGNALQAGRIQELLDDAIQAPLSPAARAELKQLRYGWRIARTLGKPGARDAAGQVNPTSFGRGWDGRTSQANRGRDTLGQAADTFDYLMRRDVTPGTSMARRFLQAKSSLGDNAVNIGIGSGLTAAGVGGLGILFGR